MSDQREQGGYEQCEGACSNNSYGSASNGSASSDQGAAQKKTSLIVNYLPQTFLDKDLSDLFSPYGQLETVRVMRDRKVSIFRRFHRSLLKNFANTKFSILYFQTGYSFGYGFVNYAKEEEATAAIQNLNGLKVSENKTIKVTLARPPSDDIKDTNIYITNLPRDYTENELINLFSQFGTIVQRNLLFDKYTGLSRGVAFVR